MYPSFQSFEHEWLFEHRGYTAQLCCSPESRNVAFHLRYHAYLQAQAIEPNEQQLVKDLYDDQPNTRIHLIWYEGEPIASVRSSIWSPTYNWAPTESIKTFWEETHRHLGLEHRILESSRYVTAPHFVGRKSLFAQLLLFRIQDLSSQLDDCHHIITSVREKHVPFYERMLGFRQISEVKRVDWVDADIVLLTATQADSRQIVMEKGMPPTTSAELNRYSFLHTQLNQHVNS